MCIVRNLFFVVVLWVVGALNLYGQCDRMGWITAIDSCGVTILDIRNGTSLKALPGVFQLQNNTAIRFSARPTALPANCPASAYPTVALTCVSDTMPCVAKFRYIADATNPTQLKFQAELANPLTQSCSWDFGDGKKVIGNNVTHTFATEAAYAVCLMVSDVAGCEAQWCNVVKVTNVEPAFCNYDIALTAVDKRLIGSLNVVSAESWPVQSVKWYTNQSSSVLATTPDFEYQLPIFGSYVVCAQYETKNPTTGAICGATCCKTLNIAEPNCYLPDMENSEGDCAAFFAPVCACDGNTYGNECEAMISGITKWWAGDCKGIEPAKCNADFEVKIISGNPGTGYVALFKNQSSGDYVFSQLDFGDQSPIRKAYQWDTLTHHYAAGDLYRANLAVWNNSEGCISTVTDLLTTDAVNLSAKNLPDGTDYVLPGDANGDRKANVFDLLNIGVGYNSVGVPRPQANTDWKPQFSPNWSLSVADAVNYKHLDSDGNGSVDDFDYEAIVKNYTPAPFVPAVAATVKTPRIRLHFHQDTIFINPAYPKTLKVDADILVGNPSEPATNLYGLAFSLLYPNYALIGTKCDYEDNSFFGFSNHILWLPKDNHNQRQYDLGFTRKNKQPILGYGKIATVTFQADIIIIVDIIDRSIGASTFFKVAVGNIQAIDETGKPLNFSVPFYTDSVVLLVKKTTATHLEDLARSVTVSPNPATNLVSVYTGDLQVESLVVSNPLGQTLQTLPSFKRSTHTIDVSHWNEGVYFLHIRTDKGIIEKKVVVQNNK